MSSTRGLIVVAIALALGRPPLAAAAAPETKSLTEGLRQCAAAGGDADRLSCYDRLAAQLAAPAEAPAAPRPSTAPVASTAAPAADFGVNAGPLQAKRQADKPRAMTAVVSKITVRPRGELVMTLDNGQVWVQNDPSAYFPLKPGDKVEISVGLLDSYVLWAPFKRSTKVTRVN